MTPVVLRHADQDRYRQPVTRAQREPGDKSAAVVAKLEAVADAHGISVEDANLLEREVSLRPRRCGAAPGTFIPSHSALREWQNCRVTILALTTLSRYGPPVPSCETTLLREGLWQRVARGSASALLTAPPAA